MFMTQEAINEIRKQIVAGVDDAKRAGVVCGYPDSFTLSKIVDGKRASATFPIFANAQSTTERV